MQSYLWQTISVTQKSATDPDLDGEEVSTMPLHVYPNEISYHMMLANVY